MIQGLPMSSPIYSYFSFPTIFSGNHFSYYFFLLKKTIAATWLDGAFPASGTYV